MSDDRFVAADFAMVRLSLLPEDHERPHRPGDVDSQVELMDFLSATARDPLFREVIAASSDALDATLDKVDLGATIETKKLRSAALSTARYQARMTHRATPFGLMAGVIPARIGGDPTVRIGDRHSKHVRPDARWLAEVIRRCELDIAVLRRLRLVANDLRVVRGDVVVLPSTEQRNNRPRPTDREQTVRYTRAVSAALAAAETPVGYSDLVGRLSAVYPGATQDMIDIMLIALVEGEFLLTDLRPPSTHGDPLRYVLDRLSALPDHPVRNALAEVAKGLNEYAQTSIGSGYPAWRAARDSMRELHASERAIHVDTRMDGEITLPRTVAVELEEAVSLAWRLAPNPPTRENPLAEYHSRFLERYGVGTLVEVNELLDPQRGLGAPENYLASLAPRRKSDDVANSTARDDLLFEMAQLATAQGEREIVLDADLIRRLTDCGETASPGDYIEPTVQVLADSPESLRAGDFWLVANTSNFTRPGAMFGRFLHLVPKLQEPVAGTINRLFDESARATPVQLVTATLYSRPANVMRVPRLTTDVLHVGAFHERDDPQQLGLADVAIGADTERFYVLSRRTNQELVPVPIHACSPRFTMPNAARLLLEIGADRTPRWSLWDWGRARSMTFLPRIRYGRTVLAPARWRIQSGLADTRLRWTDWLDRFQLWRAEWRVPDVVDAVRKDHVLRVDLRSRFDLRLLYTDLRSYPDTELQELPLDGRVGMGWSGGRAAEVVIPLRRTRLTAPRDAVPRRNVPVTQCAHLPGGEWLYAKIYSAPARHDELIAGHLSDLLARTTGMSDQWFFLRYRDPDGGPHLRVRFHGKPAVLNGELMPVLHAWTAELAAAGLISHVAFDTYRPEISRYGGPEAITAAEHAFHADSEATLTQLTLHSKGSPDFSRELLVVANCLDLAARIYGAGWREWLVDNYPRTPAHMAPEQVRRTAISLLNPMDNWSKLAQSSIGEPLLESWDRRAQAVEAYGRTLRQSSMDDPTALSIGLRSVLHLHHNRLAGINPVAEQRAYHIVRSVAAALLGLERHQANTQQPSR